MVEKVELLEIYPSGDYPGGDLEQLPKAIILQDDYSKPLGLWGASYRYFQNAHHLYDEAVHKGKDIVAYRPTPDKKILLIGAGVASLAFVATVGIVVYKHQHSLKKELPK